MLYVIIGIAVIGGLLYLLSLLGGSAVNVISDNIGKLWMKLVIALLLLAALCAIAGLILQVSVFYSIAKYCLIGSIIVIFIKVLIILFTNKKE